MVPQPLQHSSARVLEFDLFRDVLGYYVSSPLGKARVSQLSPSLDRAWINHQQQLADEARRFYSAGGRFDFSGLFDARVLLAKSKIPGASLEIDQLRDTLLLVDKAAEWREMALHPQQDPPGRHARRPRLARTGTHPSRRGKTEAPDPGIVAWLSASAGRRRRGAGRTGHHPRRAFCYPGKDRAA